MGMRKAPDTWVAPPKEKRLAEKRAEAEAQHYSPEQRLAATLLDQHLPLVDFRGKRHEVVQYEIDQLIRGNGGAYVRIIYGTSSGAIKGDVLSYLHRLSRGKNQKIDWFFEESRPSSCVVKVK